jgi:glucan 1,3-beta-glucosidase
MSNGPVNWLYGVMGIANAQRSLEVLRSITEFASQDQYKDVITMVSLVNEVEAKVLGLNTLMSLCVSWTFRHRYACIYGC